MSDGGRPRRRSSKIAHTLWVLVLAGMDYGPLGGQARPRSDTVAAIMGARILGVLDEQSGEPVVDAVVTDAITGDHALTTRTGTVSLWFVKAKGSIVQVRKLGYEPWSSVVDPTEATPITVVLKRLPVLDPVVTTATYDLLQDAGTRDGIDARCGARHVTCVSERAITHSPSRVPADFIAMAIGVVPKPAIMMHGTLGGFCRPTYYVDGMVWQGSDPPIDDRGRRRFGGLPPFSTSDLASIEVYETGVLRPLRFSGDPRCGVVVLWTRVGR